MTTEQASPAALNPSPIVAMQRDFSDFDELAEVVMGWGLEWRQLDRGRLHARVQQIGMPSMQLSRFSFSRKFHQRGTTPPGMRTVGIVAERSPDVEWRGRGRAPHHIVVFPTEGEFEFVSQPGFHGDTVSVTEERLSSVAESLGLPDPLDILPDGQGFFEAEPRHVTALRRFLGRLHATVPPEPSNAEFETIAALVGAVATGRETARRPSEPALRSRALRLALDYIEAHASEPPAIGDLCVASGVSSRTLEYAFRDRFGVTPKQYLQVTRLQHVRRELRTSPPNASISEIAAQWGFWHMGQFAADYRRQFGELPSETLRRARGG